VDEVIMLDAAGYVAEASGMNLFAVSNSTLKTPRRTQDPPRRHADTVIELGPRGGIRHRRAADEPHDLYTADEVFLTGTAAEVVGISKLDGRAIGKGVSGLSRGTWHSLPRLRYQGRLITHRSTAGRR